ncbi:MAG TPA: DbpA RNA binding domain-containing protein, partial [Desulfobacteraceae bacterium]|nr:DbpA RNA binding domain-containing protein [Desulfobacteraceae bacterium]
PALDIAAALASMAQGDKPLLLSGQKKQAVTPKAGKKEKTGKEEAGQQQKKKNDPSVAAAAAPEKSGGPVKSKKPGPGAVEKGMERFRIEVGNVHGVRPGDIVGAITNEAGLEAKYIGHININDAFTTVDLPEGMPGTIFKLLKKVRVCQHPINISRVK